MKSQKKEEKKGIIVLDKGIKTDASGDPVHGQIMCCWWTFLLFR
jgi:hypothetical protein